MRGLVLTLVFLTIASSALGAPRPRRIFPAPPAPALRGAQLPQPPAETPAPILAAAPVRPLVTPTPTQDEADMCRRACARAYYFCSAGDSSEDCGLSWGQCRSDCQTPNFGGSRLR